MGELIDIDWFVDYYIGNVILINVVGDDWFFDFVG